MSLVPTKLHITKPQARKALSGKPIQISHANLQKETHTLHLHPTNHKKVQSAKRRKKGVRLHLSQEELHGSGILDWFKNVGNKIADAGNWVKSQIIDSKPYQEAIKPIVRGFVDSTVRPLAKTYSGPLGDLADKAITAVGDKTGAYGLKGHKKHHKRGHAHHEHFQLSDSYSNLIGPMHPAFNPPVPSLPGPGGSGVVHIHIHGHHGKGGSFMTS